MSKGCVIGYVLDMCKGGDIGQVLDMSRGCVIGYVLDMCKGGGIGR